MLFVLVLWIQVLLALRHTKRPQTSKQTDKPTLRLPAAHASGRIPDCLKRFLAAGKDGVGLNLRGLTNVLKPNHNPETETLQAP